MVYRGCVLKIEEGFAIVLTEHAKYMKIIKKDGLAVGKEIIFVKEDIYREKKANIKNISLIVAVFMIMVLSTIKIDQFDTLETMNYAAIVSIDINPSIEFKINEEEKVLQVEALNTEGKELIDREFRDMFIEEAILIVIDNAKKKEYITKEKNKVLIATAAVEENAKEKTIDVKKIKEKIQENEKIEDIDLFYIQGNEKDLKEAKEENISIGKYEVYKQSKEKGQNITLDQIKNMKVQEIVNKEIGRLKEKKIKNKVKEKISPQEKNNRLEKNDKTKPKQKIDKTKNETSNQIKKQQKEKKDIQQNRENKIENRKEYEEIRKKAVKKKKEDKKEKIEKMRESKEAKREQKKEELIKRKNEKEKIEKFKENKRLEKKNKED
ncbi:MAG: anti-sigma factor domain-containing protein [Marinisporobacter sp.]|nr:anti-sigma factor domain-containing protein [Marinisporobacter sp.]